MPGASASRVGASSSLGLGAFDAAVVHEYARIILNIFGGCCGNAWALETLLAHDTNLGYAISIIQYAYIALHASPSFISFSSPGDKSIGLPRPKPRAVPLSQWTLQVSILAFTSILSNWAFAYNVPLPVQILFRSAGLAVSMMYGVLWFRRKYSALQVFAVVLVSLGVVMATLSRPSAVVSSNSHHGVGDYSLGIACLALSLVLTGALGILQEQTYAKYGQHWHEGVFYTNLLAIPFYAPFHKEINIGFRTLALFKSGATSTTPSLLVYLAVNVFSQHFCVSGVNQLTSRVSSVSTNLVLTARKAFSLCFSVWWFGNAWNWGLGSGAGLVFSGTVLYAWATPPAPAKLKTT